MDIVNTSGISTAIASIKQFNEMAVTTAKEQLSVASILRGVVLYTL